MMRLLLTGGGTLGSVTPLLALHDAFHPEAVFWIGTKDGVEHELVRATAIPYYPIAAGKFRRYWDMRTLIAPFAVVVGFFQALLLLLRLRPTVVFGAGGYVAVPVIWVAWALHIPAYTMQLDVRSGLANKLVTPFVHKVFTAFEESAQFFPAEKVSVIGSCVRKLFRSVMPIYDKKARPKILVIGGGTGAAGLNALVRDALASLVHICDVVHLTGRGKHRAFASPYYTAHEFLGDDLPSVMASADIVVTRAGMGTLPELAYLRKATIVIPLPDSPQIANADVLARAGAAVVRSQDEYTPTLLIEDIQKLIDHADERQRLGNRLHEILPTEGVEKIAAVLRLL